MSPTNPIQLTRDEAERFQRYFSVWETGLQHHPAVPFAAYDPGMWENLRIFLAGSPSLGIGGAEFEAGEVLHIVADRRTEEGVVLECSAGSHRISLTFLNLPRPGLFPNRIRVSMDGRDFGLQNIAGDDANTVLTDLVLGRVMAPGTAQNYFCNGNQWLAGVEAIDSATLHFCLQDGREFRTSRDGHAFLGEGGRRLSVLPRHSVGSNNPYRSLPSWPME